MTAPPRVSRRAILLVAGAFAAIAAFSLVMSLLAEDSRWPELPPGTFRGVDLVAGFAVIAALILLLARRRGPAP